MKRPIKHFVFATVVASLTGCGAPSDSPDGIVVDTMPSGAIRVQAGGAGVWAINEAWQLNTALRLGNVDSEGPETFGEVWAVTQDALNRVYVLDRLTKVLRVFDDTGQYVRTVGQQGSGPGEFENPFGMAWAPDGRLWVVDVRLGRYSVFDTAGVHIGEHRRQVGGYSWPWPGQFMRDGLLVEPHLVAAENDLLIGFRLGTTLQPTDTFPDPASAQVASDFWNLQDERGIGAIVPIPFGRRGYRVLSSDGTVWTGHNATYTLTRLSLTGDTVTVIERNVAPVAVSREERERAISELGDYAQHPKMDLRRIPDSKPFFRDFTIDDRGWLWVLREGTNDEWMFDVYDPTGIFFGSVDLPLVPRLLPPPQVFDTTILVVTRDSLDVQCVVQLTIDGRA